MLRVWHFLWTLTCSLSTMASEWWKSNWTEEQKGKGGPFGRRKGLSTCSSIWVCGQSSPGPSFLPLLHTLTTLQCPPHHCFIVLLQHNRGRGKRKMWVIYSSATFIPKPKAEREGDIKTVLVQFSVFPLFLLYKGNTEIKICISMLILLL